MSHEIQEILVATDRSPSSLDAVAWGAREALTRNIDLRLLYVVSAGEDAVQAHATMDAQRNAVDQHTPSVNVSTAVRRGDVARTVLAEAGTSGLVVLGSRGLKALGSSLRNSVSSRVAARSPQPTVVMRGPIAANREVIVGVDDAGSEAAIRFAFDYAHRHAAVLHAVMLRKLAAPPNSLWNDSGPQSYLPLEVWLHDLLRPWQSKYPDVSVHSSVRHEPPSSGLVRQSAGQQLLVVGSRTRRAARATVLGSVSQSVLHSAGCPVAVVPEQD